MLAGSIASNRIGHAYLFSGPRGIGKTSTARILAKALNCVTGPTATPCNKCESCKSITEGNNLDIIEIDAASNRGIDDIRQLRDYVRLVPTGGSKFKVYIIDEVHMLTTEAFNALLKTLEEPPAHAIFVLATTEKQKVPATIISRCQQCDFRRVTGANIVKQLDLIVGSEPSIEIADSEKSAILYAVARAASGSMRDAESLFDQLISFTGGKPTLPQTVSLLGTIPSQILFELFENVVKQDNQTALQKVDELIDKGVEYETFLDDLLQYLRSLMLLQVVNEDSALLEISNEERKQRAEQTLQFKLPQLLQMMKLATIAKEQLRKTIPGRVVIEMLILDFIQLKQSIPLPELIEKVNALQKQGGGTKPVSSVTYPAKSVAANPSKSNIPESTPEKKTVNSIELDANDPISRIITVWEEIRITISESRPTIAAHLAEARPIRIEDNTLIIGITNSFHKKAIEQPEGKQLIESVIQQMTGKPVRIKTEIVAPAKPESTVPIPVIKRKTPSQDAVLQEPMVQRIIDTFGVADIKVKHKPGTEET